MRSNVAVQAHEETLRKLSIRDDAYVNFLAADERGNLAASGLDEKTHSFVRLGALVAIDAAPPSYMEVIETARGCGATSNEIVGVLVAALPAVGLTRVVSAAPKLALALGYDVGAALEERE